MALLNKNSRWSIVTRLRNHLNQKHSTEEVDTKDSMYGDLVKKDYLAYEAEVEAEFERLGLDPRKSTHKHWLSYHMYVGDVCLAIREVQDGASDSLFTSEEWHARYGKESALYREFSVKYNVIYKPRIEAKRKEADELTAKIQQKVNVVKKELDKCRTTAQIEAIIPEIVKYYPAELRG